MNKNNKSKHPRSLDGSFSNRTKLAPDEEKKTNDQILTSSDVAESNEELKKTIGVLIIPAAFLGLALLLHTHIDRATIYLIAFLLSILTVIRVRKSPDISVALAVIYIPLSREYPFKIAPGINGTTLIELLLLSTVAYYSIIKKEKHVKSNTAIPKLIFYWGLWAVISILVAMFNIGFHTFIWNYAYPVRAFFDQLIIFFLISRLLNNNIRAQRAFIYLTISSLIIIAIGFNEWLFSRNISSIEKSRLLGPVLQPNEFAAQIIYFLPILVAMAAYYFPKIRSWKYLIFLVFALRVLLATFSRGAYLAFAAEGLAVSFLKSKKFFILVLIAIASVYFFIPSLVPNSLKARVNQTFQDTGPGAEIDKSADSRFYLWGAAIKMTEQSPIFGMGFDQFHRLSPSYTAIPIEATDNQNMFLYAASNMGVPSLALIIGILLLFFLRSYKLYKKSPIEIEKVIALGAMSLVPGYIVVNMFGTHMIDPSVSMFFWVYCAIINAIIFQDKK